MTWYSIKYCLTTGIAEVPGALSEHDPTRFRVADRHGHFSYGLDVGKHVFNNRADAEAAALKMAERKVASLKKALAKMELLTRKPKWDL